MFRRNCQRDVSLMASMLCARPRYGSRCPTTRHQAVELLVRRADSSHHRQQASQCASLLVRSLDGFLGSAPRAAATAHQRCPYTPSSWAAWPLPSPRVRDEVVAALQLVLHLRPLRLDSLFWLATCETHRRKHATRESQTNCCSASHHHPSILATAGSAAAATAAAANRQSATNPPPPPSRATKPHGGPAPLDQPLHAAPIGAPTRSAAAHASSDQQ